MGGHIGDMVSQHWNTPGYILEYVRELFNGSIDLDPCDNPSSGTRALISWIGPPDGTDGLKADWGSVAQFAERPVTVFCNPPFGRSKDGTSIADWIKKCATSSCETGVGQIVLLIPAATETRAWHDYIWPMANAICFVKCRVSFTLDGESKGASTKGTALVYYGPNFRKFADIFDTMGKVIVLREQA